MCSQHKTPKLNKYLGTKFEQKTVSYTKKDTLLIMKKKLSIIVFLAIPLTILFLNFETIISSLPNAYYQINPKAGVIKLEQLYKQNFDSAESTRQEANFLLTELPQKASNVNEIFAYQERVRGLFSKRDAFYTEIIRIDDKGKTLKLTKDYQEFFHKRKLADENDYEAFKIYRQGMQDMMDATLSYIKFTEIYDQVANSIYALKNSDFSNTTNLEGYAVNLNSQYSEIESLSKKGIFTLEMVDALKFKNENVGLFRDLALSISSNNDKKAKEISASLEERLKRELNEADIVSRWVVEKRQPLFEAQDQKHRVSLDLYNQAYIFARNQKLDAIISTWGNKTPGD